MATSPFSIQDTGGIVTKNDVIRDAYSQLRISGLTRSPTPEDLETALHRLENMAAQFHTDAPVGFNFEDQPDPNSDSGLPRALKHCFSTNLAVRLIPDFNKEVPMSLMGQASGSLSHMYSLSAMQRLQRVPYPSRQPVGSGSTQYNRWARFYRNDGNLPSNSANQTMFIGDVNTYTEHFDAYLRDGEDIASYSIVADSGLTIVSDSNTTDDVMYTVQAGTPSNSDSTNVLQITIIATTTLGRIETRRVFIQVTPRN